MVFEAAHSQIIHEKIASVSGTSQLLQTLPQAMRQQLQPASALRLALEHRHAPSPFDLGLTDFDELLGGGLPRGCLVEVVGYGSSGRASLVIAALGAATGGGEAAALIDLGADLDPQLGAIAGIELERLLWLRPKDLPSALSATEIAIGTGFALVALDLGSPPVRGRAARAAWLRLSRLAEQHRTALLISTPYRSTSGSAAHVVLRSRGRSLWRHDGPPLLCGLRQGLEVTRYRFENDIEGERAELRWRCAEAMEIATDEQLESSHDKPIRRSA